MRAAKIARVINWPKNFAENFCVKCSLFAEKRGPIFANFWPFYKIGGSIFAFVALYLCISTLFKIRGAHPSNYCLSLFSAADSLLPCAKSLPKVQSSNLLHFKPFFSSYLFIHLHLHLHLH
jgi:hypothetical protein